MDKFEQTMQNMMKMPPQEGMKAFQAVMDTCMCGEYHMTMDRSEKDALLYTPNAGLTTPADGLSALPPEPTLRRLSTSMYASRRCWSWSWAVAPVMPLGEVLNVLPARPTAGAAWADIPPVVSVRPGLGKAVARVAPAPAAGASALRLRSTGPCCPSRERSADRSKLRPLRAAAIWCDTLGRHGLTMPPDANDRSDGAPPCAKNRESECLGKSRS